MRAKQVKSFGIESDQPQIGHKNTPMRAKDSHSRPFGALRTPMLVEMYRREQHEEHMRSCLTKNRMSLDLLDDLPKVGVIVKQEGRPVALGFLRMMEGPYAILDSYITNPDFSSEERNEALEHVMNSLIEESRRLGVNKLLGFSSHGSLVDRSLRMGFAKMPFDVVMLDLNPGSR